MSGDGAAPDGCRDEGDSRIVTTYDPAGHTKKADRSETADVEYVYDADGSVIARTRTNENGNSNTTYFFYFGLTKRLAEETTPQGRTKVRYFVSSTGQTLAQERYQVTGVNAVDDADAGTWTWLLRDPEGNVGTHVKSDGTVTKQASYDPYGSPDLGGTSGDSNSTLGFQSDHTDDATGNLLLGPRVYDPEIDRFTTADYFVGSGSDMSLGTDPLTGNRYLFAAANPVAFYEDGHEPCPADPCDKYYSGTKKQQRDRANSSTSVSPVYDLLDGWATSHFAAANVAHKEYLRHGATGAARSAASLVRVLRLTSNGFLVVTGYVSGAEQYLRDSKRGDLSQLERLGRSLFVGSASAIGSVGGGALGMRCPGWSAFICAPGSAYTFGQYAEGVARAALGRVEGRETKFPEFPGLPAAPEWPTHPPNLPEIPTIWDLF